MNVSRQSRFLGLAVVSVGIGVVFWALLGRMDGGEAALAQPVAAASESPHLESLESSPLRSRSTQEELESLPPDSVTASVEAVAATPGRVVVVARWAADGTPAEGIGAVLQARSGARARLTGETDAAGRVVFEDLSAGAAVLTSTHVASEVLTVRSGATTTIEWQLPRTEVLHGQVVDVQGRPVPNAGVWLSTPLDANSWVPEVTALTTFRALECNDTFGQTVEGVGIVPVVPDVEHTPGSIVTRTDTAGRFTLPNCPRGRLIRAYAGGFAPSRLTWLERAPEQGLVLTLPGPGADLAGRVTDGTGAPLRNVRVTMLSVDIQWSRVRPAKYIPSEVALVAMVDGAGRWEAHGLAPGRCVVNLQAPGVVGSRQVVELRVGERNELDLQLQRGLTVSGITRADDGSPLSGIRVEVFGDQSTFVESDAAGAYRIEGLPGGELLIAFAEGGALGMARAALGPLEGDFVWNPVIRPERCIEGYVTDAAGAPLAGVHVLVKPNDSNDRVAGRIPWSLERGRLITDEDGYFCLTNCSTGLYSVAVQLPPGACGHEPALGWLGIPCARLEDVQAAEAPLRITVAQHELHMARLQWRVTGLDGRPIEGADVALALLEGSLHAPRRSKISPRASTGADGTCLFHNILLRKYRATVSAPGHTTTVVDLELRNVALPPGLITHEVALAQE